MVLKAPDFWWQKGGLTSALLYCPSLLYSAAFAAKKHMIKEIVAPCHVISIGNLTVGGAGKTPVACALADYLKNIGMSPKIICKGYKGSIKGPTTVDIDVHTAKMVGDEALILSGHADTYVSRKKHKALGALSNNDIAIIDDGHQTFSIKKDLSFIVISASQMFGNGCVFPAGPLRENVANGLSRADGIFLVYTDPGEILQAAKVIPISAIKEIPIILTKSTCTSGVRPGTRVVGFSSIGYPKKFLKTLHSMDFVVVDFIEYPDHYFYKASDERDLVRLCEKHRAQLVTTEKDAVKLSHDIKRRVHVATQKLSFDEPEKLFNIVNCKLKIR